MELLIKHTAEKQHPRLRKPNEQFPWQYDGFVHKNSIKQEVFPFPFVTVFAGFRGVRHNIGYGCILCFKRVLSHCGRQDMFTTGIYKRK
jgi:hypothetical protein